MRRTPTKTDVEIAEFYNERAKLNPANPPTRRDVADYAGISTSTAQKKLENLEAGGMLIYPLRRATRAES